MNNDLDGSGTYSWGDGRCYKGGWTANKMNRQHLYYMHWMGIFFIYDFLMKSTIYKIIQIPK